MTDRSMTEAEVAELTCIPEELVRGILTILDAPPGMRDIWKDGHLSYEAVIEIVAHARRV